MVSLKSPETPSKVRIEFQQGLAIIHIANPPVNAGSHAVRDGIVKAIQEAIQQDVSAAILIGDGRCFIAGSDLKEFNSPLAYPELPDVISTIENAPFPVIAAMHGVALGGGLELALGCDYRIASPGTKLGLPEVSLGFVPGAGGTQRLPRLTGQSRAIDLICAASRIPAEQALKDGFIDAVAAGDLLEDAINFATTGPSDKRRALMLPSKDEAAEDIDKAASKAMKRGKSRHNVAEAIRLVKATTLPDAEASLADERAVFQDLRVSADAFALRYLFFSERQATTIEGLTTKSQKTIQSITVIGGGTMGQGIAKAFLASGFDVTILERDTDALDKALASINASYTALVTKGIMSAAKQDDSLSRLSGTIDFSALADCDLAIEAVFEDMAVKKDVLAKLEANMPEDAIIATNTSYLDINEMISDLKNPGRTVGLHFFSPADRMPLLEVVQTKHTSDDTLACAMSLAKKLGKQPALAQVGEGFIGNRIYAAYRRRAELLVLDGASPEAVDKAVTGFGFAMGPFMVSDMSGLDIAWAMRKRQAATRDPQARYVTIPDSLCEAGRLGRKTGKGWYDYSSGKPTSDPEVAPIIAQAREAAGIVPTEYSEQDIQDQLLIAIVNEAACLLNEGIAQRPSDVDVVLANGYGFPRWHGGPLYWASKQDPAKIEAALVELGEAVGFGFNRGPVAAVLAKISDASS